MSMLLLDLHKVAFMQLIYGMNPILEALRGEAGKLKKIILASGKKPGVDDGVLSMAVQRGIPVQVEDRAYLDRLAGNGVHQGVIGIWDEPAPATVEDILANRHPDVRDDLILILDGIMDPQNLGSLIRTAHCCGANGVILPRHRAAQLTPAVMKASAGALHYTPVAQVVNLARTLDELKAKGLWIYGADSAGGQDIRDLDISGSIGLVMGSEGRGIRPLIRKKCDVLISIPMKGKIDSLNVSVAAGMILYQILSKKGKRG